MSKESLTLSTKNKKIACTIALTGSKSECNRALILQALSNGEVKVDNLSIAADSVTLNDRLNEKANNGATVDIGPAGTAMRFLTAFYAVTGAEVILTGTERMKQRPIGILVDALRNLGAKISYEENDGFPPIKIEGDFEQSTDHIEIKGDVSSQYITALLLVAPVLPLGLRLEIEGELTSKPYVEMTLSLLEQTGIKYAWLDHVIYISHQQFKPSTFVVEPDWSAASYWYSIAAIADEAKIVMPYLKKYSLQGDSRITEIMANFGITSVFDEKGLTITREAKILKRDSFDFKDCPDLAQTVIVCCAALGYNASFTGLETLKIKETDRVKALQNELAKINVYLIEDNETYYLDSSKRIFPEKVNIHTYEDHRMAMAFAPLALIIDQLEIEDPSVVNKSYPDFWEDLKKAGFEIEQ